MTRPNGIVQLQKDKITLKLSCNFGFDLAGSESSYCDGEKWDRMLGQCRPDIGHKKLCDFETADLCGWTQNQRENDFEWRRRNGWNAIGKLKFGPKHDHTVSSMKIETFSPSRNNIPISSFAIRLKSVFIFSLWVKQP